LLDNYAAPGQLVIDTHLGSGSSAIAANSRGNPFVGIELDAAMFDAACERIARAHRQGSLLQPQPQPAETPVQAEISA